VTFSLSIAHTPWNEVRRAHIVKMAVDLDPTPMRTFIHDEDYRGRPWGEVKHEWALKCWRWHIEAEQSHCLLLSDDLNIMPHFWDAINAMVECAPNDVMGLMSNHPRSATLWDNGYRWYRCKAWVVGPAILIPRWRLIEFVNWYHEWYPNLPDGEAYGQRGFYHDDSSINEWLGQTDGTSLHPLPAPIEHDLELGRSHDANPFPEHAAEWMSWRKVWHGNPDRSRWSPIDTEVAARMRHAEYWREHGGPQHAPLLMVPSEEVRLCVGQSQRSGG
jgi:hypothetical protein